MDDASDASPAAEETKIDEEGLGLDGDDAMGDEVKETEKAINLLSVLSLIAFLYAKTLSPCIYALWRVLSLY